MYMYISHSLCHACRICIDYISYLLLLPQAVHFEALDTICLVYIKLQVTGSCSVWFRFNLV